MYDSLFQEPQHDVFLVRTSETQVDLELEVDETYYVTIMPYDRHGESLGRIIYPASNEIKIIL